MAQVPVTTRTLRPSACMCSPRRHLPTGDETLGGRARPDDRPHQARVQGAVARVPGVRTSQLRRMASESIADAISLIAPV
jgi:hypothetical protein